jgi:[protein-PII] uridylyltransferase
MAGIGPPERARPSDSTAVRIANSGRKLEIPLSAAAVGARWMHPIAAARRFLRHYGRNAPAIGGAHPYRVRWAADFDWGPTNAEALAPREFAEGFAASMPSRYGLLFDPRTIARHAAVAFRRGSRLAHAEVWRTLPDRSAALCVVAVDRPGLLSAIAAALVLHRLDVITALVFSRTLPDGVCEAVDLVWVRRASPTDTAAIDVDEAASIGEVLSAILSGSISVEHIAAHAPAAPPPSDESVRVRFEDVDEGGLAVLTVDAPDRPGMLLTIALELFQHGAQIVRSLVRTVDGRAFNRFEIAEFSGAALSAERRQQVREAVFAAIALTDPARRSPTEPPIAP